MQFAVGVLSFLLGYWAAVTLARRSDKSGRDAIAFLDNISTFFSGISVRSQPNLPKPSHIPTSQGSCSAGSAKVLFTKQDVETVYETDSWQRLAYDDFKTIILAKGTGLKTFPCVYATMGYRSDDHRYVFLDSANPSEPRNVRKLGPALREYIRIAPNLGPNTSIVIICAPSDTEQTVEEYNHNFWEMLRGLRIWDSTPWPADVPQDTNDPKWTFCFAGEPLFPVSLTPAHARRWSRHSATPLIAMQPKWVLDKLLGTPEKREAAQNKVRKLLDLYDQTPISPDLTSYGQFGTTEAKQLCLMDDNESSECPYSNFEA